ncbi:MAG TPA: alcohol dehydrogenase family protein [Thermoanaerobaculia bacterium]|jgi:threonine dehydrogenase-like Zn-dependent dehydrogenase|nr:alcohol dehydrogenase family protein [Thermoanaerobaculia bacterium]
MKALVFEGVRRVSCASVPDPTIQEAGDAVVRVRAAAVCGSDLHVYRGLETGLDAGTVMGHELAGEVVEVGPGVTRFRAGDLVVSPFTTSCGSCFYCRLGLTARCERGQLFGWVEKGRGLHGVQAEYVRVPLADSTLVPIPEGAPPEEALFAGDVLATGWFGAESAGAAPGRTVAVVGCGPVGLMAVIAARELGAERVFGIDALPERLALAERWGAEPVDFQKEDAAGRIREATEGRGADGVVEAVGSPQASRLAYGLVRPGGTIAAVGVHVEDRLAFTPGEIYDKNLTYKAGRCPARSYMDRLLPLIRSWKYDLGTLISHRLTLEEGPRGYDLFDRRAEGCTKVVLIP